MKVVLLIIIFTSLLFATTTFFEDNMNTFIIKPLLQSTPSVSQGVAASASHGDNVVHIELEVLPELPPVNLITPPPELLQLKIIRYTAMKEMLAGENAFVFPFVENPSSDVVSVNVIPLGSSSAWAQPVSNVLISSKEKTSVAVPIKIPVGTLPGYYTLTIGLFVNNTNVSYPVIIKVLPDMGEGAIVRRELSFDLEQNTSMIILSLINMEHNTLEHVQLFNDIPKTFAPVLSQITFATIPNQISNEEGFVRWDFQNILPNEEKKMIYSISYISQNLFTYSWGTTQVVIVEPTLPKDNEVQDEKIIITIPEPSVEPQTIPLYTQIITWIWEHAYQIIFVGIGAVIILAIIFVAYRKRNTQR